MASHPCDELIHNIWYAIQITAAEVNIHVNFVCYYQNGLFFHLSIL